MKVQELLLRAPDETVSRLRSLGLADDDIATAIATFEMLPPSDIRGAGPAKLSFKTVIDEKLKLRTDTATLQFVQHDTTTPFIAACMLNLVLTATQQRQQA